MIYFENSQSSNPFVNLAIEEFMLRHIHSNRPIFHIYVNEPSVIVGRNQNVFEEIDFNYVRKQAIPVLRRLSGGGTVYHDPGNINFSLISPDQNLLNDYASFTKPLIRAMRNLGLTAELRNRSSIFISGKKVSGNAQYATKGRLLSHGTLLLNTDLAQLRSALKPRHQQISSRAVQSIRSSVANLSDFLDEEIALDTLKDQVRREFLGSIPAEEFELSEEDWEVVRQIEYERYHSWEWTIGQSPKFSTVRRIQTAQGEVILDILVEKGTIQSIQSLGSPVKFNRTINRLSKCLTGVRYDSQDITLALQISGIELNSLGISENQLISLIF
jgi:lipoate-protein ligase A